MPGRYRPPSVGHRPAKAQRIMTRVYEKARRKGHGKTRSAKIGWGAVHRAGYDPESKHDAAYVTKGPYPFVCGNCTHMIWTGKGKADRCEIVDGPITPDGSCKFFNGKPSLERGAKTTKEFDPAKLPEPDDFPGYDNVNNLRLVPAAKAPGYSPVKGLMEAQLVMPQHQFDAIRKKVESEKNYHDLEYEDSDHDGIIDRIVRRGRRNNQTNIFIDRE